MKRGKATPQQARAYLYQRHKTGFGISPHKFAAASNETGASFDHLIGFISHLYAGGAQQDQFREQQIADAAAGGDKS